MRRLSKRFKCRVRLTSASRLAVAVVYAVTCLGIPLPVSAGTADEADAGADRQCRCDIGTILAKRCCCVRATSCCAKKVNCRSDSSRHKEPQSRSDSAPRKASPDATHADKSARHGAAVLNPQRCHDGSNTWIQPPPVPTVIGSNDVYREPAAIDWIAAVSCAAPSALLPPPTPPPKLLS